MMSREKAALYRDRCAKYLRAIIKIPSFSAEEKEVILRIKQEMEALGFESVWIDDYGNIIGQIGSGPIRLVYDAHINTVGIGRWVFSTNGVASQGQLGIPSIGYGPGNEPVTLSLEFPRLLLIRQFQANG